MSTSTYVRCLDAACGWDGTDDELGERPSDATKDLRPDYRCYMDCCPECLGDTTEGAWCQCCRKVPVADLGIEECEACFEKNEAAYNKRFADTQKAIRTHNDWKIAVAAGQYAKASQLRSELKALLEVA